MRLNKKALNEYRVWLAYEHHMCQICHKAPSEDAHHLLFGCYGADKADESMIAVCRDCHAWCHANKHLSQEKYINIAKKNWSKYERNRA